MIFLIVYILSVAFCAFFYRKLAFDYGATVGDILGAIFFALLPGFNLFIVFAVALVHYEVSISKMLNAEVVKPKTRE